MTSADTLVVVFELTGGNRIELTENHRSDPKIFNFIKSLRVDEPDESTWRLRCPRQGGFSRQRRVLEQILHWS